ncbi:uncharacterized protein NPIL_294221 [Nephila pilipes]|uniref:Uncharacterized protein n=1 Tax=Nephila pilipes TaxID=299642 RepID=A0A8X6SYZ6_NEPPI|nr:uncharacterized protein NPIL_294221 [Nephila pilipes]
MRLLPIARIAARETDFMQKLKFQQLRGTKAQKLRHRIVLGFTMGTLVVACSLGYFLTLVKPEPIALFKNFEHPMLFFRNRGYVSYIETKHKVEIEEDY